MGFFLPGIYQIKIPISPLLAWVEAQLHGRSAPLPFGAE